MFDSVPWWMMVAGFLLVLGPLVTLHELGHYLVGRWLGVKADVFSVGFGKELAGWTDKRGTRWRLSALPLGGYVQFAGDMGPSSQPSEEFLKLPEWEREQAFHSKSLPVKAAIVAAGPLTNLLIAVAIFAGFFMAIGEPVPADPSRATAVTSFAEDSVAEAAGIEVGDRIVAIDGDAVGGFSDIVDKILLYPGKDIVISVDREGERLNFPLTVGDTVETDRFGNESRVGRIGVYSSPVEYRPVGPLRAVALAGGASLDMVRMMVTGLGQIIAGDRSVQELGGPIKIAKYSGEQLSLGPLQFVNFIALISLNLAFINLLPIPVLDGGHLAFYAVEAIRRKPASARSQELAFRTGLALVLGLMLFVTIIDIASLPIFGS